MLFNMFNMVAAAADENERGRTGMLPIPPTPRWAGTRKWGKTLTNRSPKCHGEGGRREHGAVKKAGAACPPETSSSVRRARGLLLLRARKILTRHPLVSSSSRRKTITTIGRRHASVV